MFFAPERIEAVREMILAENGEQRARALAKIVPMQREDFVGILREMAGLPVYHPPARSAAARVPAQGGLGDSRARRQDRRYARSS